MSGENPGDEAGQDAGHDAGHPSQDAGQPGAAAADPGDDGRPILRIVSGSPTAEELAVLTALVAASSGDGEQAAPRVRRGGWNDPSAMHGRALLPGPNAWRSALR